MKESLSMKFCQSIPQSRWRGRTLMLLALLLCIALDWKFEDLFYFTEAPEKKKHYF